MDHLPDELELAVARVERQQERTHRDAGYGSGVRGLAITERWLEPLIAQLRLLLNVVSPITLLLKELEIETLGACLLQSGIHAIAQRDDSVLNFSLYIGQQLQAECWSAGLFRHNKGLAQRIERAAQLRHGSVAYRRQAARSMAAREGYRAPRWSKEQLVRVGEWGTNALLTALPEVFVFVASTSNGAGRFVPGGVTITEAAMTTADDAIAAAVLRHPVWMPVTERPEPWTSAVQRAGPLERRVVRAFDKVRSKAIEHAITVGQMQPALDAINVLQDVAWAINRPVLKFQQWAWHSRTRLPGFPPRDELPAPEHGPWDELTAAQQKAWRTRASAVECDNRVYRSDRLSVLEDLHVALDLKRAERFWTPMNMDWRGRVYPLPHFNFQREDRVRSLFLFADGEPIGPSGIYWLKVYLANLSDGLNWHNVSKPSKLSFEERAAWVEQSLPTIQWIARTAEWLEQPQLIVGYLSLLDEPFLWLATAIELNSALATGSSFITRLPVCFDGTCSGLQHLCAMTRAPEGALVNLTTADKPQDVYQVVADRVLKVVAADATSHGATEGDATAPPKQDGVHEAANACVAECQPARGTQNRELAKLALAHGITRGLVKRNVMTYSYSSKPFGMAQQHQEDLMEPLRRKVTLGELEKHPFADQTHKAAIYLARVTYSAIEEVVHLPAQAMAFLQKLAKALAHEGKPLRWTTPLGMPWINRYCEPVTKQVKLWLHDHGTRIRYDLQLATGEEKRGIDKDNAANGVAPNFVHALDATHLLLTALAARDAGVRELATVHDSFGCLASRAGVFRDVIRRQFVSLYTQHDPLAEVLAQARQDLSEANHDKLPELPAYGPLDIEEVMHAEYCFT